MLERSRPRKSVRQESRLLTDDELREKMFADPKVRADIAAAIRRAMALREKGHSDAKEET